MKRQQIARLRYVAALWLAGGIAMALATWVCFRLQLGVSVTGFVYLIIVVVLSLMDSLISALIFSVVAVGCLNFFFTEPLFSFAVAYAQDIWGLIAFVVTSVTVTGLVRRIRRSEQRYRHLFHDMPVALIQLNTRGGVVMKRLRDEGVTDLDVYMDQHPEFLRQAMDTLRIEVVNERAIKMFGARHANELIAASTARFWEERPDTFRRSLASRFRGEPTFQEETKVLALDGRVIDVLYTVARPEPVSNGRSVILYGFVDITERVRTQEKLQRLQGEFAHAARISVLGELAASIAHEVSQPLAAMAMNGEAGLRWLNRPQPNVAEASELMGRIVADAHRASDIIARIRAMAARRAPQQMPLSLHDVIDDAMLFLRHELQSKDIAVSLDLASAVPEVLGDRTQLQQVIVNLAMNAVQAMTRAGMPHRILAIQTAPSAADALTCTLEDSGPGIEPEHLDRLFETFFTTKETGMGMGLSISRSIIERHGGKLRAENGSAYGGARFSFTLPAAPGNC